MFIDTFRSAVERWIRPCQQPAPDGWSTYGYSGRYRRALAGVTDFISNRDSAWRRDFALVGIDELLTADAPRMQSDELLGWVRLSRAIDRSLRGDGVPPLPPLPPCLTSSQPDWTPFPSS